MECPKHFGLRVPFICSMLIMCAFVLSSCSTLDEKAEAKSPKVLIVWSPVDYISDPLSGKTSEQHFLTSLENRTLFGLNSKGEIKDDLAKSFSVSDDGLTITVALGKSTFSDGTNIVSSDVKASLSRVAKAGGDYAELLENVKGFGEAKSGGDFFGMDVSSSKKIIFELIAPDPFFVYHLSHPVTGILPAASIGDDGALTSNVHSGRFTTQTISNDINTTTVFEPREKSLPTINVVRKSEADISLKPTSEAVDIVLGATTKSSDFIQQSNPQLAIASWNIYVKDVSSPFANIKFRKAVLMAMDEKESIAAYSTRAIAPTMFTGLTFDSIACETNCETNKKKAKELIGEIYPDGKVPAITIDTENNGIQKALAASAVKKLADIGIIATVDSHDPTELSNEIARGNVQLFRFGWIAEVAVGGDPLVKNYKADSTENVSGVTDATLEEKISGYQKASSVQLKLDASKALQERLKDLWLSRPVAHFHKIVTVDKALSDVEFDFYGRASVGDIHLAK